MPRFLQYTLAANPKLFSFIPNLISANRAHLTLSAQRSVDKCTRKSEDRNNPGVPKIGKKEKVAKTTSHKIYSDVASAGKKEGFLSLFKEAYLVNLYKLTQVNNFFSLSWVLFFISGDDLTYSQRSCRGHSDTGLYPLQAPATFLTF